MWSLKKKHSQDSFYRYKIYSFDIYCDTLEKKKQLQTRKTTNLTRKKNKVLIKARNCGKVITGY